MKSNKICGNAGAIHCNRKTLAGEKYFRRWEMKNTIMNTVSMPISHSHDGGVEWLCTELWVYLGVSAARGDKKDVVNNCHLFLRDSWIFIDRKMSIHLALGMFLVTFFFFFFFPPCHTACEILVPQAGIEPGPWQRKSYILTIGPPANSLCDFDKCGFLSLLKRKAWLWCV